MKGKKYKIEVARKVIKKEEEEEAETHPKFTSRKENTRRQFTKKGSANVEPF